MSDDELSELGSHALKAAAAGAADVIEEATGLVASPLVEVTFRIFEDLAERNNKALADARLDAVEDEVIKLRDQLRALEARLAKEGKKPDRQDPLTQAAVASEFVRGVSEATTVEKREALVNATCHQFDPRKGSCSTRMNGLGQRKFVNGLARRRGTDHSLSEDIKMRVAAGRSVGVGIALALGLGGCGGRVNGGCLTGSCQGTGGETQIDGPTGRETAPTLTCQMTRRTDSRLDEAVGSLSRDGSLLALLGNNAAPLQVFRPLDDFVISAFEIPPSRHYYRAALSPDNTLVAAAGDTVTVFRVADGAVLADVAVSGQEDGAQALALDFSHDGRLLATADGSDVTANIWSLPDLGLVRSISLRDDQFRTTASSVAFSPDDSRVATVTDNVVAVWNVADGSPVWSLSVWSQDITCSRVGDVMFSPDGTTLVEACLDGSNGILSATDGRPISKLGTASHGIGSVSYYDDDHILIGDDGLGARIWARDVEGSWSPSCFLTSDSPQWGQVAASAGGRRMYLHINGGTNATWIYDQAP